MSVLGTTEQRIIMMNYVYYDCWYRVFTVSLLGIT